MRESYAGGDAFEICGAVSVEQEFTGRAAGQEPGRLLELVHAEKEEAEPGREPPVIDFSVHRRMLS